MSSRLGVVLNESPNPLARLHALWTMAGIGAVDTEIVRRSAADAHPGIRKHALRVARHRQGSGLLAEETAMTLKLRRAQGIEETILRSEIDALRSTGRSLMPEGLEQSMSFQEMADLIAFLREGK